MSIARALLFLSVASLIWAAAHFYVGRRVLGPLELEPKRRRWAWVAVWTLFAFGPITFVAVEVLPEQAAMVFGWVSYGYMGVFASFFVFAVVRDLALLGWWLARWQRRHEPESLARRRFLTNASNAALGGLTGVLSAWGIVEVARACEVVRVRVPIEGLPPALEGYTIAQISDLHIGPTIKGDWLREIVSRVNALSPDLIAVTGDLVDGDVPTLAADVSHLAALDAPDGAFFVTGNHEYYSGAEQWCEHLSELGLVVLNNAHRVCARGEATFVVAGCTDHRAGRHLQSHESDPERALEGAPASDFKLLLAHQPRSIDAAARAGYDLQLSGHTHGGQFFPFSLFVGFAHPFHEGLGRRDRTWIYVNRGTGYWGPPLRQGVPAEITLVELVSTSSLELETA